VTDNNKQKKTVNKNSIMVRNQRPSSNDRNDVYFVFLLMRQRQDTILVILGYHICSRTRTRKKKETRLHSFSWNSL